MPQAIEAGTILITRWPPLVDLESELYAGPWATVKDLDVFALDRRIRAAGWNFFFIASDVKAMFLGSAQVKKIQSAMSRILGKVTEQHYNSLEVTGIITKHFLRIPYTVVSVHPRHLQQNCYLDSAEARRLSMSGQNSMSPSRILFHSSGENGASLPAVGD